MVLSPTVDSRRNASAYESEADAMRADARSALASTDERMRALYQAHARPVFQYLLTLTLGQYQTAEDLLQETMIKVWRNIDRLHPDIAALRPWLFTVARHLAIDAARARSARPSEVTDVDVTGIEHGGGGIDRVLAFLMVKQAMASLSPEHRSVIIETYLRGRSKSEAAMLLGIPDGTLKSRSHYALLALRSALQTPGE